MKKPASLTLIKQRLAERTDSEHGQAIVRLAIVLIVLIYFFSDFFAVNTDDINRVQLARSLVLVSFVASIAIFAAILFRPAVSVIRRLVGMIHDVTMISAAIYLGENVGAPIAVTYLWITLGNGFRYGMRYLYGCAALSVAGFLVVYASNDYWRDHGTLSLTILLMIVVVPPYVGSLLKSLHIVKDQLRHQASTDALTGLLNRAEIEASVSALYSHDRSAHVLLFCDLDRFKEVNDVGGHAAGDELLAAVARIIRDSVRQDDLSGRIGGDEFCALLRKCSLEKGRQVAETIRHNIAEYRLAWGTHNFSVGISIGVVPASAVDDSDALFRLADAACYAAKNAGRNCVHVIDPRTDLLDTQKIRRRFDADA